MFVNLILMLRVDKNKINLIQIDIIIYHYYYYDNLNTL